MREGYKETSIGELPENWIVSRLELHSDFITKGATPTTYGYKWENSGILFLRSECVSPNGFSLSGAMYISEEANDAMERSKIIGGDILMTITGNVGRVCVYPHAYHTGNINQHIARIRISDLSVSSKFIFQYLSQRKIIQDYEKITTGQAYPQLSLKQVRETNITIPPYPEQKHITDILSTVDEKIEVIDLQIAETQDLKKGLMQRLLTKGIGHTEFKDTPWGKIPESWDVVKFGSTLASSPEYGANASAIECREDTYRYIRITDIHDNGSLIKENVVGISKEDGSQYELTQDDILIARTGNTVGKSYIYNSNDGICSFAGYLIRFRPNPDILNPRFIFQYLHSELFFRWLNGIIRIGAQPNVNSKEYQGMPIPLPPINEQLKISEILVTVDEKLGALNEKKEHYQDIKKGLMQQLLTGKIRVNGLIDNTPKHE